MSEIQDRVDAFVKSERTPGLFIHSVYDDMNLSLEAFRLLAHLSRRSGNDSQEACTSYLSMGRTCFKGSYPSASDQALERRAMRAMKELIGYGLVRVEATTRWDGGQGANKYILTHCKDWNLEYIPGTETTIKRGNLARVTRVTPPPVTPLSPPTPLSPLSPPGCHPCHPPGVTGVTQKVIHIEGTPNRRYDRVCQNSEILEIIEPEPNQEPTIPLSSEVDQTPKSTTSRKKSAAARRSQKETARTKKIPKYHPEEFEQFWGDYKTFCVDVEASVALNQTRWEAVEAWDSLIASGGTLEAILEGSSWYFECKREEKKRKGEALGVSHAFRYLRDRKWEAALEHKQAHQQAIAQAPAQAPPLAGAYDRLRVKSQINDFLKMLNWPAVLPSEWQQRTGKLLVSELPPEHAPDFLAMLEREYQALTQVS